MESSKSAVKAPALADVANQISIYRTVVIYEHDSLRHFVGGKFFISKGNWAGNTHRLTRAKKGYILLLLLKIPKSREGEAQGTCRHREPGALAETPGVGH